MTEDRGAFKTIPRNPAQSGHFVIDRDDCGMNAAPPGKSSTWDYGHLRDDIL
jgi:hypothetical protein